MLVLLITVGILACIYTTASAIACLLGGAVVIGNLYLLGMLGRFASRRRRAVAAARNSDWRRSR